MRTYARIKTEVWRDPDWLQLTGAAQRLYWLLLSQPKLSLCGTLELAVGRWSRAAADTTPTDVEQALKELDLGDSVVVDIETEELAIRTFLRHDLNKGRMNKNLAAGFWRSWECVESRSLRFLIISQITDEMWDDYLSEHAPEDALDAHLEWERRQTDAN